MFTGIVGTTSGTLWYVNWEDKTSIRLVGGHPAPVNDIAFSSGDTFAVAIQDGSLRLWNYGKTQISDNIDLLCMICLFTLELTGASVDLGITMTIPLLT